MKIYGYTILDTLGYGDGTDTRTYVFRTEEERNDAAYKEYCEEYNLAEEEEDLDNDQELLDKTSFISDFEIFDGYVRFYRTDSSFQIISFAQDI